MFRRRHRLHGPIALYGGRIDPGKGCEELIEYFSTYVQDGGDASLVLMGVKLMPLPEEPFIRFAGRLPDQERLQALEAATVVVVPVAVREPVAAGAGSVRRRHADPRQRAQRGARRSLPARATPACTTRTATSSSRAEAAARRPRACARRWAATAGDYVRQNYRWDVILQKYEQMFTKREEEVQNTYCRLKIEDCRFEIVD